MAVFSKTCAWCGKRFESNRRDKKYDKASCRKNAAVARAKKHETKPKPVETDDTSLKSVITRQIAQYGLSDHWRAAEAIALAEAMDRPDTGAAKAALSRQLTSLMEKLEALSRKHDDGVDEVMEHARRLRKGETS